MNIYISIAFIIGVLTSCGQELKQKSSMKQIQNTPSEIEIENINGEKTILDREFSKEFLFFDFSREGCGDCQESAARINRSHEFQSTMTDFKCSMITVTPKNGLNGWIRRIGRDSWIAKHSFRPVEIEYDKIAEALQFEDFSVPLFLLIDKQWNIVKQEGLTESNGRIKTFDNVVLKRICSLKK